MHFTLTEPVVETHGRRVVTLGVDPPAYARFVDGGGTQAELLKVTGVPADVGVVAVREDTWRGTVDLLLTHTGYHLVPFGSEPPLFGAGDAGLIPPGR